MNRRIQSLVDEFNSNKLKVDELIARNNKILGMIEVLHEKTQSGTDNDESAEADREGVKGHEAHDHHSSGQDQQGIEDARDTGIDDTPSPSGANEGGN